MQDRRVLGLVLVMMSACGGGEDAGAIDAPAVDAAMVDVPLDADLVDAAVDAAVDAPPFPGVCDPLAPAGQQGCLLGQKCTWVIVQDTPETLGALRCVPDGVVQTNGACTQGAPGETTGYDDCAAGLICVSATCRDICGFDGSANAACAPGNVCARYANLFENGDDDPVAGVCNLTCDPLTQLRSDGASCGAGNGCYVLSSATESIAVCAVAGTGMHGQGAGPYANSCVPGAQPRRSSPGGGVECGGLCRVADVTSTTNMASEGGVAPDSCETRWGAAPPDHATQGESCRYWWAREPFANPSALSNTLGWCFKHSVFTYDSDNNGSLDAAFPRCTTLTTGDVVPPIGTPPHNDAQYFWCVARPAMLQGAIGAIERAHTREPALDRIGGWRSPS